MSVVYSPSQYSSACDNVTTGPYTNLVGSVGGYIYKNAAGQTFKDHIKGCIEVNAGAHYYVQSDYECHTSASTRIDLSKVSINPQSRNGFISLSMVMGGSKANQCDVGLGYMNGSWRPTKWCKDVQNSTSSNTVGLTPAASGTFGLDQPLSNQKAIVDVTITVSATASTEKIVGSFKVGSAEVARVTYTGAAGDFFVYHWSKKKPLVRFVRFMSLVPLSKSQDDRDYSTLEGTISNLKLDGNTWDASGIEYAWSVQGANIESLKISTISPSSVGSNADYIKINHRYQLT